MDKFSYVKGEGIKNLLEPKSKPAIENSSLSCGIQKTISQQYVKDEAFVEQNLYFIISGGTTRERAFFQELEKKNVFAALKVVFLSSPKKKGGLTPKMMEEKWAKIQKEQQVCVKNHTYDVTDIDKVFMVTDVDDYYGELVGILKKNDLSCKWIISNPDIEIWLYYCYFNNPNTDLAEVKVAPQNKRSSLMKTVLGRMNNGGGVDPRKAFLHLKTGISNSKKHLEIDENGIPILFSTNMGVLCEDVLGQLGSEYDNWIENKRKKTEMFKSALI